MKKSSFVISAAANNNNNNGKGKTTFEKLNKNAKLVKAMHKLTKSKLLYKKEKNYKKYIL